MSTEAIKCGPASDEHLSSIADIYAHYVATTASSFELTPPDVTELSRRKHAAEGKSLPFLVATHGQHVVGFAYASPYAARPAFGHTVEDSIYIHQQFVRRRLGHDLLTQIITHCERSDFRQIVAVIDSTNRASIELHRTLGYWKAGELKAVGYKLGRWVDATIMQRPLGLGATGPPTARNSRLL